MKLKKIIFLMSALAAAALISSCNNDENPATPASGTPVRFTATIANQTVATASVSDGAQSPVTRVSGDQWEPDDYIGIYMTANGTTTIAESVGNRSYFTSDGTGNFSPWNPDDAIYYPMDGSAVDFIAYYPYYLTVIGGDLIFDSTINPIPGTRPLDLLWAKSDNDGAGYNKKTAGPIALEFRHCLAKLTMNVKADPSVGTIDPATMTATIRNTPMQMIFHPLTGIVEPGTEMQDIHPYPLDTPAGGYLGAYTVTTPPATYTDGQIQVDFKVDFPAGSETFTWDVEAVALEPGKDYVYDVTITRTGVTANGTIIDWVIVNKGEVTAQ